MIEINGKHLCESCFSEMTEGASFCTKCGYNPSVTVTDPTLLKPGSILLGKYIVGKMIGKGGFGVTYAAYDVSANRMVAIKEFFPYGLALRAPGSVTVSVSSEDKVDDFKMGAEKFYNEAKLVSKFNGNPNIVGVHEFFYENDTVYFAMEYLQGHTLKEHIDKNGVLPPAKALYIAECVSNALMAAHSSNVLHRDISPDNVILCDNGDVKLIDFGAARQVVAEHSQSFSVILKPGFAPLEQYQKKGNQGPWTDIYSLGATIYYCLTQDIPDDPMTRIDDDSAFASNPYNIEPELWAVIQKALGLKIEDRYGDVFMLRNDLSHISYKSEPVIPPSRSAAEAVKNIPTANVYGKQPVMAGGAHAQPTPPAAQPIQQAAQPVQQPVQPVQQPMQPVQQMPPPTPMKKPHSLGKGKIAAIAAGAAAVVAAAIIIPIAVKNSAKVSDNDVPSLNSTPSYSTPSGSGNSGTESLGSENSGNSGSAPINSEFADKMYYLIWDDEKSRKGYEALYNALTSFEETMVELPAGYDYTSGNINALLLGISADFPELGIDQFLDLFDSENSEYSDDDGNGKWNGKELGTKVKLNAPSSYGDAQVTALKNEIQAIDSDFTSRGYGTVDKLKAFRDYLKVNTELKSGVGSNAYDVLCNFEPGIYGFEQAFNYYAQYLGLRCITVSGDHEFWCRVEIDGKWYNVDAKAGSVSDYSYFLRSDKSFEGFGYEILASYQKLLEGEYAANEDYGGSGSAATNTPTASTPNSNEPTEADLTARVEAADKVAAAASSSFNSIAFYHFGTAGAWVKSGWIISLKISVDSSGRWSLAGLDPDYFDVPAGVTCSSSVSGVTSSDSQGNDIAKNFLIGIAQSSTFSDLRNASFYVMISRDSFIPRYVFYSPDSEKCWDLFDSGAPIYDGNTMDWNGKTAGVTPSGAVVGTSPKLGLE